jgi:hypothetical protein
MAYDAKRETTVIFGGFSDEGQTNDTWEWDGATWTQRQPLTRPAARMLPSMTFDAARGVTILFGGEKSDATISEGDTWEWDGTNWTERFPAASPSPRSATSLAYDSARNVTVLLGGRGPNTDAPNNETWEWDGSTWSRRRPTASPEERLFHSLAYSTRCGVTLVFSGYNPGNVARDDTWTWDGAVWTLKREANRPPARGVAGLAYDSRRGVIVMFGGITTVNGELLGDTWEW